jgi:hypothetical protein
MHKTIKTTQRIFGAGTSSCVEQYCDELRNTLIRTCCPDVDGEYLTMSVIDPASANDLKELLDDEELLTTDRNKACVVHLTHSWTSNADQSRNFALKRSPVEREFNLSTVMKDMYTDWCTAQYDMMPTQQAVFFNHSLEMAWGSREQAKAALLFGKSMLLPHGVLMGITIDGGRAHHRYEAAQDGCWTIKERTGSTRCEMRFGPALGQEGDWPTKGAYGRALSMKLELSKNDANFNSGADMLPRWQYAVDRDELVKLAREVGLREHTDAHGLVPAACWNAQEWFDRTKEPMHKDTVEQMTMQDWNIAAMFAVFAFELDN